MEQIRYCAQRVCASMVPVSSPTLQFGQYVTRISEVARFIGLIVPVFTSPPPRGMTRSIRGRGSDRCVVSVKLQNRNWDDVIDDIVDGFVEANELTGPAEETVRRKLREGARERRPAA